MEVEKRKRAEGLSLSFLLRHQYQYTHFPPPGLSVGRELRDFGTDTHTHINTPSVTTATSARRRSGQRGGGRTHRRLKITGSSTQVSSVPM